MLARRLATLTPQQIRVLMMLSQGLLNKQIAYELTVSEATVKAHVSAILQKLGVESRTQAVILATKIEIGAGAFDRLLRGSIPVEFPPSLLIKIFTKHTNTTPSRKRSAPWRDGEKAWRAPAERPRTLPRPTRR